MERLWLVEIRNDKQLTQDQVAILSGIERPYYTMIENGKRRPSVQVAQNIAKALSFEWAIFFNQNGNVSLHKEQTEVI